MKPKAVILSGGPASVLDKDAPLAPKAISMPAYRCSASVTASRRWRAQLGGTVEGGHHREFGRGEVLVVEDSALFEGVWKRGERYPVWMSHGDRVTVLPKGFRVVGTSENAPIAMIATRSGNSTPHSSTSK